MQRIRYSEGRDAAALSEIPSNLVELCCFVWEGGANKGPRLRGRRASRWNQGLEYVWGRRGGGALDVAGNGEMEWVHVRGLKGGGGGYSDLGWGCEGRGVMEGEMDACVGDEGNWKWVFRPWLREMVGKDRGVEAMVVGRFGCG